MNDELGNRIEEHNDLVVDYDARVKELHDYLLEVEHSSMLTEKLIEASRQDSDVSRPYVPFIQYNNQIKVFDIIETTPASVVEKWDSLVEGRDYSIRFKPLPEFEEYVESNGFILVDVTIRLVD